MTTLLVREFKCQVWVSGSTRWIMRHKCIHMRAKAWKEGATAVSYLRKCTLWMQTKQMDTSHLCVCCRWWWPTGGILLYWIEEYQMLRWSTEGSRGLHDESQLIVFIIFNGMCESDIHPGWETQNRYNEEVLWGATLQLCLKSWSIYKVWDSANKTVYWS